MSFLLQPLQLAPFFKEHLILLSLLPLLLLFSLLLYYYIQSTYRFCSPRASPHRPIYFHNQGLL